MWVCKNAFETGFSRWINPADLWLFFKVRGSEYLVRLIGCHSNACSSAETWEIVPVGLGSRRSSVDQGPLSNYFHGVVELIVVVSG